MTAGSKRLWADLTERGIVSGPMPAAERVDTPWYVKGLAGFSGWLAALFLLGFLGAGFASLIENPVLSLIAGAVLIGGAFAVLRSPHNDFLEHLGLAVSLAGQALLAWGLFQAFDHSPWGFWSLLAGVQVLLAIGMPSYVHRVFSAYVAALACSLALHTAGTPYIFDAALLFLAAWLWLNEFRFPAYLAKVRSIAYGLVLALIQMKSTMLLAHAGAAWPPDGYAGEQWAAPWMSEVLSGMVTLYVVWQLLRRSGLDTRSPLALALLSGTLLFCLVSLEAQGITLGVTLLLLGFSGSNRVLLGLGVLSLLSYVSFYYYLLDLTLLEKSLHLFLLGLVVLALRWVMLHFLPGERHA